LAVTDWRLRRWRLWFLALIECHPFGTENSILEDLFSSGLSQFKKYHPSGNLKINYTGIFQSLKLRILMEKIISISPKLNFTQNNLGC